MSGPHVLLVLCFTIISASSIIFALRITEKSSALDNHSAKIGHIPDNETGNSTSFVIEPSMDQKQRWQHSERENSSTDSQLPAVSFRNSTDIERQNPRFSVVAKNQTTDIEADEEETLDRDDKTSKELKSSDDKNDQHLTTEFPIPIQVMISPSLSSSSEKFHKNDSLFLNNSTNNIVGSKLGNSFPSLDVTQLGKDPLLSDLADILNNQTIDKERLDSGLDNTSSAADENSSTNRSNKFTNFKISSSEQNNITNSDAEKSESNRTKLSRGKLISSKQDRKTVIPTTEKRTKTTNTSRITGESGTKNETDENNKPRLEQNNDEISTTTTSGDNLGVVDYDDDEDEGVVQACDASNSPNWFIFCSGRLLDSVNELSLFDDSKTFVDRPLKFDAKVVLEKFEKQFPENEAIDRQNLSLFLQSNFDHEGTELMTCELNDWQENPPLLASIRDQTLKDWALELNKIWRRLCRQITPKVLEHPDRYSLIYTPKPFVVPGGRFREFYYWDAYWIIRGLIVSGMVETARHMIENFLYMVERYGFVPNGGRVYYLRRSQPPFLTAMVYEYYEATLDYEFIRMALPILEKEIDFWHKNRSMEIELYGQNYTMFQYRVSTNVPRPESNREDVAVVKQLTSVKKKRQIWRDIATAAESGWDFSSRWMRDPLNPDLKTIETTNIIEVDLNGFMCWNYDIISYLYWEIDNETKAKQFRSRYHEFRDAFQKVFYVRHSKDKAGWYDYNLRTRTHNTHFYPSIAVPLFTRCYHPINLPQPQRIFQTMEELDVFKQAGGIPASLVKNSTQQWDWPNGWSPSNHMIIEGLRRSENPIMQQKAFWLAEKWVLSNYRVYRSTHSSMWEKYNVIGITPNLGSGGEYEVQAGFGWTNGVILDLLSTYGDRMVFHNLEDNPTEVAKKVISNEPKGDPKQSIIIEHKNEISENGVRNQEIISMNVAPAPQGTGSSSSAAISQLRWHHYLISWTIIWLFFMVQLNIQFLERIF